MDFKSVKFIPKVDSAQINHGKIDNQRPTVQASPLTPPKGDWKYINRKIIFNGKDVGDLIENSQTQPTTFFSQLASQLEAFRQHTIRQRLKKKKLASFDKESLEDVDPSGELAHLSALVDAYIAKIMRKLKRKYDEASDGISYVLDEDGQLVLNGVNVTSFIEMAQNFPTAKALTFLKGLKNRLKLILSNKANNSNYEKIRHETEKLCELIDEQLKQTESRGLKPASKID